MLLFLSTKVIYEYFSLSKVLAVQLKISYVFKKCYEEILKHYRRLHNNLVYEM